MPNSPAPAQLELRIQQTGLELFTALKSKKQKTPGAWWNSKLIEQSMSDEKLKVQLFRFVDVLPALRDSGQIARHMDEYFNAPGRSFPGIFSWGASLAGLNRFTAALSAAAIRKSVEEMAYSFICGSTPAEAMRKVAEYRKKNLCATLDLLGEAVVSEAEADAYAAKYLALLDEMERSAPKWAANPQLDVDANGEAIPKINVSLKLTSLYSQLDAIDPAGSEAGLRTRLEKILDRALAAGAFVNVDMEDYHVKDLTLRIFRDVLELPKYRAYRHFGIVIQAYLKDAAEDLRALAEWAKGRGVPVTVRLVKGAYWDYETIRARQHGWDVPVFEQKGSTDANFEACSRILLESFPHLRPALASHNVRSLATGLAQAEALQLPKNAIEIQGLYGMADPLKEALAERGYRVRVYMPFGELLPGMAYLVRRLLENTANDSFLRQGMVEGVSEQKLMLPPLQSETPRQKMQAFENEPEADFFRAETRERFKAALGAVRAQLGRNVPLLINGKPEKGGAGEIVSRNPSRLNEIVGTVASASIEQADRAVLGARAAFAAWRDTPLEKRAGLLRDAAARMRARKFELCAWEVYEAAKPWREADGDVAEAIDFLDYYATEAERVLVSRRHNPVPGETNENLYQPRGVTAVLAPWNFPLAILTGMAAAALVAGNTVILKPAEQTPVIGALLAEILHGAGVPAGALQYLPGEGETIGAHLVKHPQVNLIAFTGSKDVGLWINAEAAKTREGQQGVKRVICEMGGKNAIVIDEDADLDEAVLGTVQSAFGFAGQKCSAASRAIVVGSAYEPFLQRLVEATRSIRVAAADDAGCRVPPVIDAAARERILKTIARGKTEAKTALDLNAGVSDTGAFVAPVIFRDVPPKSSLAQDEIFGPVLSVLHATTFEQALEIALDVPFALTGGLYSRSPANVAKARAQFRVGNLYINRNITGAKVDRHPFGGFKFSGIGSKAGGPDYLLQYVEPRTITENTLRRGFAPDEEA